MLAGCNDTSPPDGLQGPDRPLGWSVEPLFEVGGVTAPAWATFGEIAQLSFDDSGRLYLLDASARQVTVIDAEGSFAGTVGVPGDGPGGLAAPTGFVRDRDGDLIVFDQARRGFVVFDSLGVYVAFRALDPDQATPVGRLGLAGNGRVFSLSDDRVASTDQAPPNTRDLVLHPVSESGTAAIVYRGWAPPTPPVRELTPEETGGMRVRLPPVVGFHPAMHAVWLGDGRFAVVDSTDYRIRFIGDGAEPRDIGRDVSPTPVDESLRNAEREHRLRLVEEAPARLMRSTSDGDRSGVADDAVLRLQRARIAGMGFHEVVPVIERLAVDEMGHLWVRRAGPSPDQPGPIDVIDPDGGYLGTLSGSRARLPDAFGPEGRVAYIERDDFGATRVEVGRLSRSGGARTSGG